jgi:IS30 family transposase
MRHYTHLSPDERDRIAEMHARHQGVSAIARDIGRDKSTVSRELARNGRRGRYGACKAQERADKRHGACRPRRRLDDPALADEVRSRILDDHWSPEQIDGRLRLERGRCVVSLSTIYRAVNEGRMDAPGARGGERVRRHLRRKGKGARRGREETRGRIKVSHRISERPAEADARSRLGDWEDDTVVGPGTACLVGIVDRASRLLVGGKSDSHTAEAVGKVEVASLGGRPLKTVTPDRGKEFANHEKVSKDLGGVQFYFCEPHHPWQKPTVENTNGLIREFFPKGTDFSKVTDEEVQEVFGLINDRPRKVLGYRTANEVYREMLHSA